MKSAEEAHLIEQDMTVKYGLIDEVRLTKIDTPKQPTISIYYLIQ